MEKKPLKRMPGLKPYSIDHHQGLLLCWKIRTGIKKGIEPCRIGTYVQWFYIAELVPHFKLEENYIFPVLGSNNDLVKQALSEHKTISELVNLASGAEHLLKLEEVLEKHIRFEERVLFEEVQRCATQEKLEEIEIMHGSKKFVENTTDEFWK